MSKRFPSKTRNRTRTSGPPILSHIVLTISQGSQVRERQTVHLGKSKLLLFTDDMVLYIEEPKNSARRLLELTKFSNVEGQKLSTQKSVAFLYTFFEREI